MRPDTQSGRSLRDESSANAPVRTHRTRHHRHHHAGTAPKIATKDGGGSNRAATIVGSAIAICMIGGGGGNSYPLAELIVELSVTIAAILLILHGMGKADCGLPPLKAWLLGGLIVILPIAQLVPLPAHIWQALPGREAEAQTFALLGRSTAWMPLSVSPWDTFASLLGMMNAALLLLMVASLSISQRSTVCLWIAAIGLLSILLGGLQLASGSSGAWSLYDRHDVGYLIGLQASRNSETEVLKIALLAAGVGLVGYGQHAIPLRRLRWIALMMALLSVVAVVLTGSRTGIVLLPLGLAGFAAMIWPTTRAAFRLGLRNCAILLALVAATSLAASQVTSLQRVFSRFSTFEDARTSIWEDARYAAQTVWPVGGGIGTFETLFEQAESLEYLDDRIAGHAHNDWLEWVMETGLAGILTLVAGAALLIHSGLKAVRGIRQKPSAWVERAQVTFGATSIALVALHALVDYPLRNLALAGLTAVAAAMLVPPRKLQAETRRASRTRAGDKGA